MKIKLTASAYSYIVVMVIALLVVVSGLKMRFFESKLLPLVLGSSILFLAAAGLWRNIRLQGKTDTTITEAEGEIGKKEEGGVGGHLIAVAWTVGFILAIYLLGFLISMPLFIFSYMKTHNIGWRTTITGTIITTVAIYFGFQTLLGVELYPGLLFTWLER